MNTDATDLTARLVERGHAYEVDGNVYFDVQSFPDYGKLTGNTLDAGDPVVRRMVLDSLRFWVTNLTISSNLIDDNMRLTDELLELVAVD